MKKNNQKKVSAPSGQHLSIETLLTIFSDRQIELLNELSPLANELNDLIEKVHEEGDFLKHLEAIALVMRKIEPLLVELNEIS